MSKANIEKLSDQQDETRRSLTFLQMVGSIGASFFGVQSAKNRERDFAHGNARAFILVGILMTIVWYGAISLVVHFVLRYQSNSMQRPQHYQGPCGSGENPTAHATPCRTHPE